MGVDRLDCPITTTLLNEVILTNILYPASSQSCSCEGKALSTCDNVRSLSENGFCLNLDYKSLCLAYLSVWKYPQVHYPIDWCSLSKLTFHICIFVTLNQPSGFSPYYLNFNLPHLEEKNSWK